VSPVCHFLLFFYRLSGDNAHMNHRRKYRLIDRTKAGRNIEVVFDAMPHKHVSTGTKDMSEAVEFANKYLAHLGLDSDIMPTFGVFAKGFYTRRDKDSLYKREESFRRNKRELWYDAQEWYLDKYIMPFFSAYKIDMISSRLVEKWLTQLTGINKDDLSGNSKRKILSCLRIVLDDAVGCSYISYNPARQAMQPKDKPVMPKRPLNPYEQRTLFPDSVQERLTVWLTPVYAAYFSVMYDTGFRPQEVAALKVKDVYTTPRGRGVYTDHTICFERMEYQESVKTSGKGMESRVGLLTDITSQLIDKVIDQYHLTDDDFLFLLWRDKPKSWIQSATGNKKLRCTCKRLGLDTDICQYSLRHTFATYRRGNLDEATLALSMGHAGGKVRNDYDHRTAQILLMQLERDRDKLFNPSEADSIKPLEGKKHG
jgi:integrase